MTIERSFYIIVAMEAKRTIQSVAKAIGSFHRQRRRMPSYAEMLSLLGVRSKSVVHFWVNKLREEGLLEKDDQGRLMPGRRTFGIPVVGEVVAGIPSHAEEELRDIISLDEYLVARPDVSFLLQVSGDSMIGAGIIEGDLVIVEKDREPKSGDIVIAAVDGEWTMKYFRKQGGNVFLAAANPKYPNIIPKAELRMGGVVTAVIRKYNH